MRTKKHDERTDLVGEHRLGDGGQILFACLFLSVWIADTFVFQWTTILNAVAPVWLRIPAGILALVAAGYLSKSGLSMVFGEEKKKPELIRRGVFDLVRHPVYLGEILLYLGFLLFSLSLAAAAVWILAILFLHFISRHEEKLLLERFGQEYRIYMKDVPMWIPSIRFLFKISKMK